MSGCPRLVAPYAVRIGPGTNSGRSTRFETEDSLGLPQSKPSEFQPILSVQPKLTHLGSFGLPEAH